MSLQPGTALGPYHVTAKIGGGGMGEVSSTGVSISKVFAVSVLLLLVSVSDLSAQTAADKFVGAWTMVSWVMTDTDGNESYPYGPEAVGQIVYTETGRVAVHQMNPDAELPDVAGLTPSEALARIATTFFAYYGTYTVDESAGTVTHHLEGAMEPTWVGTDQVREFEFVGDDRLILLVTQDNELARSVGAAGTNVVAWERVRK